MDQERMGHTRRDSGHVVEVHASSLFSYRNHINPSSWLDVGTSSHNQDMITQGFPPSDINAEIFALGPTPAG